MSAASPSSPNCRVTASKYARLADSRHVTRRPSPLTHVDAAICSRKNTRKPRRLRPRTQLKRTQAAPPINGLLARAPATMTVVTAGIYRRAITEGAPLPGRHGASPGATRRQDAGAAPLDDAATAASAARTG